MNTHAEALRKQPNYLAVFWALAALTAVEIGITYLPVPRIPFLVPIALAKASLVAMYYMHLKTDAKIFRWVFTAGVIFGIGLILSFILLFAPPLLDLK